VGRHGRRVEAVVRAVCRDRAESQDVCQEAFTRAWTNLDLLVEPGRFGAWLRRIAFACAIDWLRRRPPAPEAGALLDALPASELPADAVLAERELTTVVRAAIARLPARYRRPLVLYHLDGLRQDRIADVLGVPPGTVRSLITRARHALKADLSEIADELLSEPVGREILHICNGHATMNPLRVAGVPGRFRLSCDPLLLGPCPRLWGEPWRDLRVQFLTGGSTPPAGAPDPGEEIWDDDVERALSADGLDEIVLWYEHDLYDQLLLIRLLALVARHTGARRRLSLVCIGVHPAVPAFKGLGQLTPDQLASLFETRASITDEMIALGRDAWTAYTASDPREIELFLERDLTALPFLGRALRRHLEEYPGVDDGLSRTERHLLALVHDGVVEPRAVWRALHDAEDCYYIADSWLLRLLESLAGPPAPLVVVNGNMAALLTAAKSTLSLTPLGEAVLRGRTDWLASAGIDRWLGGVHLTDPATAWRWRPADKQLSPPGGDPPNGR
jgi:RNA polymerase sigma factor (sigma-70 family)